MKQIYLLLCLWAFGLCPLSAQTHLEAKAKQHFMDNSWREATVLFELTHKTQCRFENATNYGRAIVSAYQWKEGNRLTLFYRMARADSLSFEKIISLSDEAMAEVKTKNEMGNLLLRLIEIEQNINDPFWDAIVKYLILQREYEKAYQAKLMQVGKRTIKDKDRIQLATLALENNETDIALKYYREVLTNEPQHPEANIGLGSILYVKGKNICDKHPQTGHYFMMNIEEEYDRYVWLLHVYDEFFKEASAALKTADVTNYNRYTSDYIEKMDKVKVELDGLQRKLHKVEKYKRIVPNNNLK